MYIYIYNYIILCIILYIHISSWTILTCHLPTDLRIGLVEAMVQSGSNSLDLDLRYGCW